VGVQPANADPVSDAQKQLDQLEAQTAAIEDQYNASMDRLTAAQDQQKQLTSDIAAQQAQIDALRPSIIWLVTMQRQTAGVNMTTNFLLDDSEDGFLTSMSTVASVTTIIDDQVSQFVSEQQRLNDLKQSLDTTVATIQTEVDTQKQLLADSQQKEQAQQQVVNNLTAQQRAAYQAQQTKNNVPPPTAVQQGQASDRAMIVVNYALKQYGKRYVFGTAGPNTFDCSGLTMAAYAKVGIALPHGAAPQAKYGRAVSRNDLLPGDLVFFYNPIKHVGIYIGNGQVIHASTPSTGVKISAVMSTFNTARRLV